MDSSRAVSIAACEPNAQITMQRDFGIDNLLVPIPSIIEMILVDRPCAMQSPFSGRPISTFLKITTHDLKNCEGSSKQYVEKLEE